MVQIAIGDEVGWRYNSGVVELFRFAQWIQKLVLLVSLCFVLLPVCTISVTSFVLVLVYINQNIKTLRYNQ